MARPVAFNPSAPPPDLTCWGRCCDGLNARKNRPSPPPASVAYPLGSIEELFKFPFRMVQLLLKIGPSGHKLIIKITISRDW